MMDRETVLRWCTHRINNDSIFTDFDWSFTSNYLKHVKGFDITPQEVKRQAIRANMTPQKNLIGYMGSLLDHVTITFNIKYVFEKEKGKLLKIY